jgi:hypothetical protein
MLFKEQMLFIQPLSKLIAELLILIKILTWQGLRLILFFMLLPKIIFQLEF